MSEEYHTIRVWEGVNLLTKGNIKYLNIKPTILTFNKKSNNVYD